MRREKEFERSGAPRASKSKSSSARPCISISGSKCSPTGERAPMLFVVLAIDYQRNALHEPVPEVARNSRLPEVQGAARLPRTGLGTGLRDMPPQLPHTR